MCNWIYTILYVFYIFAYQKMQMLLNILHRYFAINVGEMFFVDSIQLDITFE